MGIMEKIFGDLNAKEVKKIEKTVDIIESYDEAMQALSDEELRAKTDEFRARLAEGETLESLPLDKYKQVCDLFEQDVYEAIALERCTCLRNIVGGPAPDSVRAQVAAVREKLM